MGPGIRYAVKKICLYKIHEIYLIENEHLRCHPGPITRSWSVLFIKSVLILLGSGGKLLGNNKCWVWSYVGSAKIIREKREVSMTSWAPGCNHSTSSMKGSNLTGASELKSRRPGSKIFPGHIQLNYECQMSGSQKPKNALRTL